MNEQKSQSHEIELSTLGNQYANLHTDHGAQSTSRINNGVRILSYIKSMQDVSSFLDVGCGGGYWLAAANQLGIYDILGVEGDWLDKKSLAVNQDLVLNHDLETDLNLGRKFDLVSSVEVAEHITYENAQVFVKSLVSHGELVLFSAAIPGQGGVNHVNEQWQSYWAKIFRSFGYVPVDLIRKKFWSDKEIFLAYRQNMILYVRADSQSEFMKFPVNDMARLDLVHPKLYMQRHKNKLYKKPQHTEWMVWR